MDNRRIGIESWIINVKELKSEFNNILKKNLSFLPTYQTVYFGDSQNDAIESVNNSEFDNFIIQLIDKSNILNEKKTMGINKKEVVEYIKKNSFNATLINIREFFNATYSGTIKANNESICIELWCGNHMLNDTKTKEETFYGIFEYTSFKWHNCNDIEKNIMINALRYFTSLSRGNLLNISFYADFIFNIDFNKYVFIDYSTHSFWCS